MLQVSELLQASCQSVVQLFEQGKDFNQDLLGITVLNSLLQLAHRVKDDSLAENTEDMRSAPPPIAPRHSILCNLLHTVPPGIDRASFATADDGTLVNWYHESP